MARYLTRSIKMKNPMPAALFLTIAAIASVHAEDPADLYPPAEQRLASPGHTAYHINPAIGDDAATGRDRDHAWRTFRRVNQLRLAPGDRVEIEAPGPFDQTLALIGAGTAEQPVEVHFAPGRYDFHPDHMFRSTYQISNTNDDSETPKAVGLLLDGTKHFRVSGPGATIVCRGKMIEVCIDGCEDINVSGLAFDYHRPTVSEFKVEAVEPDHVDLRIHRDSAYTITDGKITWQGEGWSYATGLAQELDLETNRVHRRKDPLQGLVLEEVEPFLIRARGKISMKPGHVYQVRDTFRDCCGTFTRRSRDITWKDVSFHFIHGMGMVSQFSENLTVDSVSIAPDPASGRTTAAWADCIHISGCRGKVRIKDCVFSGAHDDAVNIHGTYLRVVERLPGNQIKVRFMQRQTFGFLAFNPGDHVDFVHSDSLANYGSNRVKEARLINPKEILLTLAQPVADGFREDDVLENVTWTPEVEIRGCNVSRIPTRGFLITTRHPVVVEDNTFSGTWMSALHVSGDAKDWFESGCVRDMMVIRNHFNRCGEPVISINPSNNLPNAAVHRNIRIEENEFNLNGRVAVKAHGTTGLRVTGNTIHPLAQGSDAETILTADCAGVVSENNKYQNSGK